MSRIFFRPKAREDLHEIWSFTEQRWGEAKAEAYINAIRDATAVVCGDPSDDRDIEGKPGYFLYRVSSHVIVYIRKSDGIDVIRGLHARMDFRRHIR